MIPSFVTRHIGLGVIFRNIQYVSGAIKCVKSSGWLEFSPDPTGRAYNADPLVCGQKASLLLPKNPVTPLSALVSRVTTLHCFFDKSDIDSYDLPVVECRFECTRVHNIA